MATPDETPAPSERIRVNVFRLLSALLLLFGIAGLLGLGIGFYVMFNEPGPVGWAPVAIVAVMALAMGALVVLAARGIAIRSVQQLQAQSETPVFDRLNEWLNG